jgi:hypothetical protein
MHAFMIKSVDSLLLTLCKGYVQTSAEPFITQSYSTVTLITVCQAHACIRLTIHNILQSFTHSYHRPKLLLQHGVTYKLALLKWQKPI